MIFLMILLCTYILAVNFYGFRLLRSQKNACVSGEIAEGKGDGKLLLAGALGGALAVYITMFILKYRLDSWNYGKSPKYSICRVRKFRIVAREFFEDSYGFGKMC